MITIILLIICLFLWCIRGSSEYITGGGNQTVFHDPKFMGLLEESLTLKDQEAVELYKNIPFQYRYPLDSQTCVVKKTHSNGQRKLCLEQIQFLTKFGSHFDVLLYVGSAPGYMHGFVSNLFPNKKFILVDPNNHNMVIGSNGELMTGEHKFSSSSSMYKNGGDIVYIYDNGVIDTESTEGFLANYYNINTGVVELMDRKKRGVQEPNKATSLFRGKADAIGKFIKDSSYKFYIIQDLFTTDMAKFFVKALQGQRFAFTSDMRSRNDETIDYEVLWNMAQQYIWTKILRPVYYKLKFRIPFQGSIDMKVLEGKVSDYMKEDLDLYKKEYGIDQIEDYKKGVLRYFPGNIYLQPWAPIASTESRLVGTREDIDAPLVTYTEEDYTAKYFYYNSIWRQFVTHHNPYVDIDRNIDKCGDCALEIKILEDYRDKIDGTFNILEAVDIFRNITKFRTSKDNPRHGGLYKNIGYKDIYYITKRYKPECIPLLPSPNQGAPK